MSVDRNNTWSNGRVTIRIPGSLKITLQTDQNVNITFREPSVVVSAGGASLNFIGIKCMLAMHCNEYHASF